MDRLQSDGFYYFYDSRLRENNINAPDRTKRKGVNKHWVIDHWIYISLTDLGPITEFLCTDVTTDLGLPRTLNVDLGRRHRNHRRPVCTWLKSRLLRTKVLPNSIYNGRVVSYRVTLGYLGLKCTCCVQREVDLKLDRRFRRWFRCLCWN